jgi:ATP/maltotriose-dependent transcriptional regulator MalT/DNA-binding SARP family transcriptional activator
VPEVSQPLAKLTRPHLQDVVPRERLFGVLDELRRYPLIWMAAPPGAGKTTLVGSWLDSRKLAGIWYQVDSGDADPATFFYYLGLAARPWQRKRPTFPVLAPELIGDLPGFARRFFRELFARLGPGHVLAFDNLHELPEGSTVLLALAAAAEEAPSGTQIVLISREEPSAAFARLTANRRLSLVGAEQLSLTPEETVALAAARIEVDPERAKQLYRLSAGWAAGLSLIVERIRRGLPGATLVEPDSHQEVFDYFAAEILDRASPENQQILLRLCFFPRFTPDQAVTVSGNLHAPRLLDYLYRRQLFVERRVAPGTSGSVYQFHALFQAFLIRQAALAFPRDALLSIVRATGRALEASRGIDDAVPLYLQAEDWDGAARAIRTYADRYLRQGRRQLLISWVAQLPQGTLDADPWLQYWTGLAHASVDPGLARQILEQVYPAALATNDKSCQAQSAAAIVGTIILDLTQFDRLDRWIRPLERAIEEGLSFPDAGAQLRVLAALVGAVTFRQGNPPALRGYVGPTLELLAGDAEPNLRVAAGSHLLRYGTSVGDLGLVQQVLPLVERLLDDPTLTPLTRGLCELFVGWSYFNLMDDRRVQASITRLELVAKEHGLAKMRQFAALLGWWLEMTRSRYGEARRCLAIMEQVADPNRLYDAAVLTSLRAWSALAQGDASSGRHGAQEAVQLYDRLGSSWHRLLGRGMLMWAHVELGDWEAAHRCMDETKALGEQLNIRVYDVHRHQARAMMALRQGNQVVLRDSLRDLFACAARYGTGLPARFFPNWMPRLCAHALAAGIEVDYVRELIRRFGWHCDSKRVEQWPWQVRIYTLGRFAVYIDDQPLAFTGRAPRKTLNLLKALICLGGTDVRDHRLIDAIWPDDEADAARAAFSVTLHRLRKLLGSGDAIRIEDGLVSLNLRLCWVDAFAFEHAGDHAREQHPDPDRAQAALELYRGNLLPGDLDEPWSASLRERLKARFIGYVRREGERQERAHDFRRAIELYSRGVELDDLTEAFYQGLMRCHLALGCAADAAAAYRRMRQLFSVILGIKPNAESDRLYAMVTDATSRVPPPAIALLAK